MIIKLFKRTVEMLKDPSRSFKERVFLLLTFVTVIVALLALVGDLLVKENPVESTVLAITAVLVPIGTIFAIRKNKVQAAVRFIIVGLVGFLLPLLFYFGGGLTGGGVLWIIFAYLYTGLVLSGLWKPFLLLILSVETIIFYAVDYYFPGKVKTHTREMFYIDSLISMILVGVICCIMVWFVEWLFMEENKRAKEEAKKFEELNKSQNRFFSNMSHEIRTPINSILGLNELILRDPDATDEIRKDAGNIQGAGRMLLSLVNDILDISKIEAGKMEIIPVNYSVESLISEIVNMMWLRAEQKGLEFNVQIDPSLPRELFGDEVRIKQILINLLNNAVKYTKEGTVTLHIEKEDIREDSVRIMFSVIDTGMGIKQESLPYLFDAFQRADEEVNRKIEGTGLGLSIVKQLVDLMGGEIAVNSVYSQGSTFTVNLWQKVSNPAQVGDINISSVGSAKDTKAYEATFKAPDAKILIVDDNEMNLEVEKKLLEGTQIAISTADSGAAALNLTSRYRFDLILMDHLMPEMSGVDCLQRIRKQQGGLNNHVPVIVLTANAGSENRELYSISGFDGYLLKPVSGQQLETMLLEHLPESKVIQTSAGARAANQMNTAKGYSKKIPVLIGTSTMCDLPMNIFYDYQIDIIPFKVHTDGKEYFDVFEADSDEIIRYMKNGKVYKSEPPMVEEFEHFYGRALKRAHQVIYIAVADSISNEYRRAKEASKNYGNVFVFDSGFNSSSLGMMVLMAYKMSVSGMSPGNIISELNKMKSKMQCSFVTSDPRVLFNRSFVGQAMFGFMDSIGLKPFLRIRNDTFKLDKFVLGSTIKGFEKYVDYALPRWVKPDLDLVFVTYVDLTKEELAIIEKRILSRAPFRHIFFQKACSVMALTCGSGAFGVLYIEDTGVSYNLEKMLDSGQGEFEMAGIQDIEEDTSEGEHDAREEYNSNKMNENTFVYRKMEERGFQEDDSKEPPAEEEATELKWYEDLEGIDSDTGIENSGGSEDSYKSVMGIFYNSIDPRGDEIADYYDNEDWENYTIKVHALKSSARLIGATKLSEDAEALEMAGKANNIDFIKSHHYEMMEEFRGYKSILDPIFAVEEEPEDEEEEEIQEAAAVDTNTQAGFENLLIRSLYEAVKECLAKENYSALAGTIKEMQDYTFPAEHKEIMDQLKAAYDKKNYDEMKELLSYGEQLLG